MGASWSVAVGASTTILSPPISSVLNSSRRRTSSKDHDRRSLLLLRSLSYGQNFTVQTPDAARIAKVSLIRFGSVTHAINMSQRFIPLSFSVGSGSLTVTAPANANLAPPGNYMLFLVDTNGIPSVAAVVHF